MDDTGASIDVSKAAPTRKRRSSILKSQRPPRTPFSELEFNVATPTDTAKSRRVSFSRRTGVARKRRSSILKSQRPPRTPFSELEFNVATPTDTAKSRRVSFSRRTGVAEFVTNEATTTWKNFYEEHNKSLESSGNESAANPRQVIEHIGKRIFDQQFQEIEVVDIGGTLQTNANHQSSINNVNVSQELTTNEKLTEPIQNFELSSMTDHQSRIFGDELSMPVMADMSNPININFSNINPIGDKCDDLEEIERDLERSLQNNVICSGPFTGRDMSEYIEIDLNMTHVGPKHDDCDMSITEPIQSPNVQTVSKSNSFKENPDDWVVDKENIVVNPYVTPKESKNFALNDADDNILVFDGKKLCVQSDKEPIRDSDEMDKYRCLLPNSSATTPQRKTIFLNVNDDLPNFIHGTSVCNENNSQTVKTCEKPNRKTIVFDDGVDISITQAVPSKVLIDEKPINVTRYDNDNNLSMTQAVVSNIENPKRKTIVFDEGADISMTQAIPSNVFISKEKTNDTLYNDNNLSITQAVISNLANPKRKTIMFEDGADISLTEAIPSKFLIDKQKNNVTLYDNDNNLSITQAVMSDYDKPKRKTIVFEEGADISITQAVPSKVLIDEQKTNVTRYDNDNNLSITQAVMSNYDKPTRKTIVFEEGADISITQAIPSKVLIDNQTNKAPINDNDTFKNTQANSNGQKRKTIIFDGGADVSMTQAIPSKVLIEKVTSNTRTFNNADNLSVTQTIPIPLVNNDIPLRQVDDFTMSKNKSAQDKTMIYQDDRDLSITRAIPANIIENNENYNANVIPSHQIASNKLEKDIVGDAVSSNDSNKRRTIFDDNISMTEAIPNVFVDKVEEIDANAKTKTGYDNDMSMTIAMPSNVMLSVDNVNADISTNDTSVPRSSKNFIDNGESSNLSLTKNYDNNDGAMKNDRVILRNSYGNASLMITKPIPSKLLDLQQDILKNNKSFTTDDSKLIDNNHDVLVYQAKESITLSQLKNMNDDDDDKDVEESNSVINISEAAKLKDKSDIFGILSVPMLEDKTEECEVEDDFVAKVESFEVDAQKPPASGSFVIKTRTSSEGKGCVKKTLLNELLDMSYSSLNDVLPEPKKPFNAVNNIEMQINESHETVINVENDNLENNEFIEHQSLGEEKESIRQITAKLPALEYREDSEDVHHLQDQIDNLKVTLEEKMSNRHYETVLSSDLQQSLDQLKKNEKDQNISRNVKKSFKNADDTNELLEMLSNFTEGDEEEVKPFIDKKPEPKRLSFAPNRQSIVLSREDLLNNISMAHAALQQSKFEMDDSESIEDTKDLTEEPSQVEDRSIKKSVRMSNEVVKTLQFDEEDSISESSIVSEIKASPLKKTAFGEVSYMRDSKAKVIPTYLKDVSDNLKALMIDLVKPMADVLPFDTSGADRLLKPPSTCSTQIQANLITSSQIDIDTELHSNTASLHSTKASETMIKEVAATGRQAISQALNNSNKQISNSVSFDARIHEIKIPDAKPSPRKTVGPVIVFDHTNPLNNIVLTQPDNIKVHRYNPLQSSDNMNSEYDTATDGTNKIDSQYEVERVSTCYNVETNRQSSLQSGDTGTGVLKMNSIVSNTSKPVSIDKSIDGFSLHVKNTEVNTLISMKETKEILEANSSLTLVDDGFGRSAFDLKLPSEVTKPVPDQRSPVRVIYKLKQDELLEKLESDLTSVDDSMDEEYKRKKRTYSPTKRDRNKTTPNVDLTPKPVSKMQKISNSPKQIVNPEKLKRSPKPKDRSPEKKSNVSPRKDVDQKLLNGKNNEDAQKTVIEAINGSTTTLEEDILFNNPARDFNSSNTSSYKSSKCGIDREASSDSHTISAVGSNVSRVNWQTDLVNELSSKNIVNECSSGDNVVAKINTLPFMGSRDCEWESSTGDVWMFRLLRTRMRLIIRLAHTLHNATRSRVRADTPIVSINVDSVLEEESDPLASLVIRLSRDAMRAICTRCVSARDVPHLLRCCAAIARVAPRWARAMRDARARLAYELGPGGELTFKVANFQLRSVWEVRMRIKLVVEDDMESWPCASDVRENLQAFKEQDEKRRPAGGLT
ncbi:hypothetical protein KGM_205212 [Danaus plexippus plexippus]|uniref:Uncharacterized protein n=1 Tax=Danaus plexippus plexippus TaxID=278856 RepID=A0A212F541_DANPL|nr:hypothetical protein KGM_205212 [Danaus plexippus plexippus]